MLNSINKSSNKAGKNINKFGKKAEKNIDKFGKKAEINLNNLNNYRKNLNYKVVRGLADYTNALRSYDDKQRYRKELYRNKALSEINPMTAKRKAQYKRARTLKGKIEDVKSVYNQHMLMDGKGTEKYRKKQRKKKYNKKKKQISKALDDLFNR